MVNIYDNWWYDSVIQLYVWVLAKSDTPGGGNTFKLVHVGIVMPATGFAATGFNPKASWFGI
jgi:hypothetical protein